MNEILYINTIFVFLKNKFLDSENLRKLLSSKSKKYSVVTFVKQTHKNSFYIGENAKQKCLGVQNDLIYTHVQ